MNKRTGNPEINLKHISFNGYKPPKGDVLKNLSLNIELKNMDFQKINDNNLYEGVIGVSLSGIDNESKDGIFDVNVAYSVIIEIEGFNEDEIMSIFHINLSNFAYPYIRSDINRVILDSGFPKVSLPLINFSQIYNDKYKKTS